MLPFLDLAMLSTVAVVGAFGGEADKNGGHLVVKSQEPSSIITLTPHGDTAEAVWEPVRNDHDCLSMGGGKDGRERPHWQVTLSFLSTRTPRRRCASA